MTYQESSQETDNRVHSMTLSFLRRTYRRDIVESGQKVYIGEDIPYEYTQSKYMQNILLNNPNIIKAKNRASENIGEMIEIVTNRRWEKTKHPTNKDAKYGMYRYDTRFGFPVLNSKKRLLVLMYMLQNLLFAIH